MNEKKISRQERLCISECIHTYWGQADADTEDELRDKEYEECLNSCQICG